MDPLEFLNSAHVINFCNEQAQVTCVSSLRFPVLMSSKLANWYMYVLGSTNAFGECWKSFFHALSTSNTETTANSACRRSGVLECLGDASSRLDIAIAGVRVGPPTASSLFGPSVPRVSFRGPAGVPPMPKQDGIGSRAPTLSGCAVCVDVDLSCGRCSYTHSSSKFSF